MEEHCAKVLLYLIHLNAVPAKAEDEAKKDFLACIHRKSHNVCTGTAAWLLTEQLQLHQSPKQQFQLSATGRA